MVLNSGGNKVTDFIGRVVKEKAKGTSTKKAMQQILIDFTQSCLTLSLRKGKIILTKVLTKRTLGLILRLAVVEEDQGAYPNAFETRAVSRRKKEQISHLSSV